MRWHLLLHALHSGGSPASPLSPWPNAAWLRSFTVLSFLPSDHLPPSPPSPGPSIYDLSHHQEQTASPLRAGPTLHPVSILNLVQHPTVLAKYHPRSCVLSLPPEPPDRLDSRDLTLGTLGWVPFPAGPSALASLKLGGNEIAVSGAEGSCSHSLRQTHSSVRLIGPEWRPKRPPMDTPRLVIKLQAFVLLSVGPPLPSACLPASSWLPTHPLSPGASPHALKNWLGATTAYRTERPRPPTLHCQLTVRQDDRSSGCSRWPHPVLRLPSL